MTFNTSFSVLTIGLYTYRASALERAPLRGADKPTKSAPQQAVLAVIAIEKDGASEATSAPAKLEKIEVDDMKLCFPELFEKFGFLGTARVIQVRSTHVICCFSRFANLFFYCRTHRSWTV